MNIYTDGNMIQTRPHMNINPNENMIQLNINPERNIIQINPVVYTTRSYKRQISETIKLKKYALSINIYKL